jgi:hypothetical protein
MNGHFERTPEPWPQETIEVRFSPEVKGDDPHRPG